MKQYKPKKTVTEEHVALVELLKDEGADLITLIERLVAMNKIDLYVNNNRNYNRILYTSKIQFIMSKIRLMPQHIVVKSMGYIPHIDSRNLI